MDERGPTERGQTERGRTERAFLVTLHNPGTDAAAAFVAVQAAHSNRSHRFADLASAFRYLEGLTRPDPGEGDEDDASEP